MTQSPPPGWYTDPSNGTSMRWWDGTAWSMNTMPAPQQPVGAPAAQPVATIAPVGATMSATPGYGYSAVPPGQSAGGSSKSANQYAFITFGVVALYILLAVTTHVVLIGVVPVLMAVRSLNARESLAPVAIGAAIVSVVVAFTVLTG